MGEKLQVDTIQFTCNITYVHVFVPLFLAVVISLDPRGFMWSNILPPRLLYGTGGNDMIDIRERD